MGAVTVTKHKAHSLDSPFLFNSVFLEVFYSLPQHGFLASVGLFSSLSTGSSRSLPLSILRSLSKNCNGFNSQQYREVRR